MPSPDESGKFSTNISADVIDEAVKAVERREQEAAGEASGQEEALRAELAAVQAQLEASQAMARETSAKLKDEHERFLRATADLENYKKRAAKERDEVQRYGAERLLKDLFPVLDNLDRALEQVKATSDVESLQKGVELTRSSFEAALGKHGVKAFTALGQPFDPSHHEAVSQAERADLAPGTVVQELMRGFTLNERLVRPALVVVSKAPPEPKAAPEESDTQRGA